MSDEKIISANVVDFPRVVKARTCDEARRPPKDDKFTTKTLKSYINRIGAEQLNFKRYIIREYIGKYYEEKTLITINEEGDIHCTNKDNEPTKDEAAAIKREWLEIVESIPTPIGATEAEGRALPKELGCAKDHLFFFHSRDPRQLEGKRPIIMAQQRIDTANGKKYVPWTFFDDGKWRAMECGGKLPFWKPPAQRISNKILICEGAKAAKFVDDLCNTDDPSTREMREAHPWYAELKEYEAWGMIGGALAPHRADYDEIPGDVSEVVYVCDNDHPGETALAKVSECYGKKLKGILFDYRWQKSWDLADEFPKIPEFWGTPNLVERNSIRGRPFGR